MRFQLVISNLKMDIFTTPTTFHGTTIGYHDLKIIESMNIEISFVGNATMNKIVGATIVKKDDDLLFLNVSNELEHLLGQGASEGMQGNKWVNCRWVNRLLGGIGKGGFFNNGNCHILFRNIFGNGHK
jgi:hypothetical protein